ncbi:Gfo/Idh/MocA family oxidoreductase [Mediterraneibacter sp. NSJ-55]|uniref:Gfo/Idh/MocA family oxidoreductase n=1 Tax=Mediterraneibacter hominis TaxID=2763054 RepID=A0A923RRF6_9FIRM|nr:Gfo/Idh/MocA family oxidoreductase [Mediterraneibacter hominis]MBC5688337.1 Gfo/Idh/MocA family oxidoreductase [Mediterraneibacter hominis]
MQKFRVAVIGLGFIGKQHIEALRRIPSVEIVAAADTNAEMESWCGDNRIENFYTDCSQMLQTEKLDVVHNCTPNFMHYDINKMILNYNCHVYSEKPLTLRSEEGEELVRLACEKQKRTAVNFNYRNNLMVQEIHDRYIHNHLGKISHLQAEYLQDWLLYDTDFDWRIQTEKGGESRAVADIGSHCFDTIQYVTEQRIVSVYAKFHRQYAYRKYAGQGDTFSGNNKQNNEPVGTKEISVENEDAAYILFRLEDGTIGTINVTQVCAGKKNGLKLLISGTKESCEWTQENPDKLWIGHRDRGNEILCAGPENLSNEVRKFVDLPSGHPVGWKDALTNGVKIFYQSLSQKNISMKSPEFSDGCYVSKIVEACVKSNKTNQWTDVCLKNY